MDRRTAFVSLFGLAGAGATLRWSRIGFSSKTSDETIGGVSAQPGTRKAGREGIRAISLAQVPIGGGGFVTGIDISSDGQRLVCRTDVANAYVRDINDRAWQPLFSPSTLHPSDYDPLPKTTGKADGQGVAGVRISPSNREVIFASYHGYVWRSVDGGKTMQRTRLPQKTMFSNAGWQRLFNRTIDVHPHDPQKVVVGTWGDGVWYSVDGGDHWDRAKLPASVKSKDGQPGLYLVAYDSTAADRLYAFVTGVGLFRSEMGPGGDFRALTGGPTICSNLVTGPDGMVYLCEQSQQEVGGRIWRNSPKTGWASGKPDYEMLVVAVDPSKPTRLVAANANGYFVDSIDGGRTFRSIGGADWKRSGGEVRWTGGQNSFFPAQLVFDPTATDCLWVAQGVGVAKARPSGLKYQVEDWSSGIEELCAVATLCVPGGKTFMSAWDKSFWRVDNLTAYTNDFRYPVRPGKIHDPDLVVYGSYLDFAGDDPRYMVGIVAPTDRSAPGFSANGGDSWQEFRGTPKTGWGNGGCIASSTKKNIVLLPSNNGIGVFTLDGGATWSPVRLDGINPTGGFANSFYVTRKNISADKTRPGTFALLYTVIKNDAYGNPLGGVWLTRDGGTTWDQVLKGVISSGDHDPKVVRANGLEERQFWACQLEYIPGRSGELVYTPHADFAADRFFWSRDDGKSWAELHANIRNVRSFGFGKAVPGQARQAMYFWGEMNGSEGLYATFDWFATTPRLLTRFPSQMLAKVSCVAGDPDRIGRAYVGTSCAGWVRIDVEL